MVPASFFFRIVEIFWQFLCKVALFLAKGLYALLFFDGSVKSYRVQGGF